MSDTKACSWCVWAKSARHNWPNSCVLALFLIAWISFSTPSIKKAQSWKQIWICCRTIFPRMIEICGVIVTAMIRTWDNVCPVLNTTNWKQVRQDSNLRPNEFEFPKIILAWFSYSNWWSIWLADELVSLSLSLVWRPLTLIYLFYASLNRKYIIAAVENNNNNDENKLKTIPDYFIIRIHVRTLMISHKSFIIIYCYCVWLYKWNEMKRIESRKNCKKNTNDTR